METLTKILDKYSICKLVSITNDKELIWYEVIDDKDFTKYGLIKFIIYIQGSNIRFSKYVITYTDFKQDMLNKYNNYVNLLENQNHRMYNISKFIANKYQNKRLQYSLDKENGLLK